MSEQKDMILENFLSSEIRTLDTDEIYNILMDSLILLLHPQGLLLTQNLNTGRSFCTVRRWGEVFFEKDYSVPSDAFLEEILHQKGLLLAGPDLSIDDYLLTTRQSRWVTQQNSNANKKSASFTMGFASTCSAAASVLTASVTMQRIFCAMQTCITMRIILRSRTVSLPYITENMPLNVSKMPVRRIPRSV